MDGHHETVQIVFEAWYGMDRISTEHGTGCRGIQTGFSEIHAAVVGDT